MPKKSKKIARKAAALEEGATRSEVLLTTKSKSKSKSFCFFQNFFVKF